VDAFRPAFVSFSDKEQPRKNGEGSITTVARTVNTTVCYRRFMNDPVVVYTAQGELDETQVRSFLSAHGIPTFVRGEALRKTHALTLDGLGAVEVLVAHEHAEEARNLLDAVQRGELALPDEIDE
jgi:hypothetical protein